MYGGLAAALLAAVPAAAEDEEKESSGTDEDLATVTLPEGLSLYRPNYALPLTWSDDADGSADAEFKYQLSFQYQVARTPVYVSYTQTAYFRWLDDENSRPFRETNYNPEVWYRFRPGRLRPDWLGLDLGYEHESNGEDLPQSRSWDRGYARAWFDQGRWYGSLKVWERIPEGEPSTEDDPDGDDNPDIVDYYGHHELQVEYTFEDGDRLAATSRYSFSDHHGALRLDYATPTGGGSGYWYVQLFTGYGESLETYRENRTRIGIGFALLN
ncbi:MAG: phospholipase A [Halofilum sp. (in: g-proteobacteria)]